MLSARPVQAGSAAAVEAAWAFRFLCLPEFLQARERRSGVGGRDILHRGPWVSPFVFVVRIWFCCPWFGFVLVSDNKTMADVCFVLFVVRILVWFCFAQEFPPRISDPPQLPAPFLEPTDLIGLRGAGGVKKSTLSHPSRKRNRNPMAQSNPTGYPKFGVSSIRWTGSNPNSGGCCRLHSFQPSVLFLKHRRFSPGCPEVF